MKSVASWLAINSAVAIAYYSLGKLGLAVALPPGYVSAIWPAAGLAFAVTMLRGPKEVWAGIFIGSVLINAGVGGGFHIDLLACVIAAGSTLQAIIGGLWLRRSIPTLTLESPDNVLRFSLVGVASSVIAATVGNVALLAHGYIGMSQIPQSFVTWWLGDAFGVQIFAPLTLLILAPNATWRRRRLSVGLPLILSFLLCGLVYYFVLESEERQLQRAFAQTVEPFENELHTIDRIDGQALSQIATSYNVRSQVPGPEMLPFLAELMKSLPSLRAISWAPLLDLDGQRRYVGSIWHPTGFAPSADGLAAPISLIYPESENVVALGLDLMGEAERAQTLKKALQTHALSATRPIKLAQDPQGPGAVLLMAPVQTQTAQGVISGVIDLRMIDRALKDIPGISWELRDLEAEGGKLIYQSSTNVMPLFQDKTLLNRLGLYRQIQFKVANREWRIVLYVSHKDMAAQGSSASVLVLVLALLTCGTFSTFALITSAHSERVEATVHERTIALNVEIEARKADQRILEQAKAAAEHANLAKSQFLATMSHEIRTPMNGILGMAQLLLRDGLSNEKRMQYVRTILGSGKSLMAILNDILDLSKVEAGKLELVHTPFDPIALVNETSALFQEIAKEKGLNVLVITPEQSIRYMGDAIRVRQMLSNFLSNAIKFSAHGSITVQMNVQAPDADSTADTYLEFSVDDQGIGIAPDKLKNLFQPFSQVDSSATRRFGGTGLGLSIVKRLAESMGGTIGVDSANECGSRFWFKIPLQPMNEAVDARNSTRGNLTVIPDSTMNPTHAEPWVLVVEDNFVNRMVVQGMLSQLGVAHRAVEDGAQALAALESSTETPPFLVLMDCQMPVMDGYTATQKIRQEEQESGRMPLRIVALTAGAFQEDHQRCLDVGMDDFITKPLEFATLQRVVQTAINSAQDHG